MLALSPGWELDVHRGPDWLMVTIGRPRGSQGRAAPLAEVLWDLLERHLTHRLVVDFSAAANCEEDLIEQLVELYERVAGHGGVLRVCGLSQQQRRALREKRFDDRLIPYSDIDNAVHGSAAPRQPR